MRMATADAASAGTESTTGLDALKRDVDAMQVTAGAFYNQVSNTIDHLSSLKAGYSLDLSSKMDVDFAGETTELAKGQILAQAGNGDARSGQCSRPGHARSDPDLNNACTYSIDDKEKDMTTINAGGAFYRVQNSLDQNSSRVSDSMQRLASGKQNIAPGDRTASSAVAFGMKAELASLKVGIQNGTEALNAIEMITNDIAALNDMVVRLEELNALGENGFNSGADTAALSAEAAKILTEFTAVQTRATWKGNAIFGGTNNVAFGRNTDAVNITLTGNGATSASSSVTASNISNGTADVASTGLDDLKRDVDAMQITAGAFYNQVSNTIDHLSSLKAGYSLDLSSKMDVDFAGETTELAKGQILAQAGTAMLAQANAQGQGMLALIQI